MHNRYKGFTFIELIFVIGIILTLVMVSTPRFIRSYRFIEFNTLKKDLLALSKTLQQSSVLKSSTIKMTFNLEKRRIEIFLKQMKNGDISWTLINDPLFRPYKIPYKSVISLKPHEIFFYPDNRITGATLSLSDSYGHDSLIIFDDIKQKIYIDTENG